MVQVLNFSLTTTVPHLNALDSNLSLVFDAGTCLSFFSHCIIYITEVTLQFHFTRFPYASLLT